MYFLPIVEVLIEVVYVHLKVTVNFYTFPIAHINFQKYKVEKFRKILIYYNTKHLITIQKFDFSIYTLPLTLSQSPFPYQTFPTFIYFPYHKPGFYQD